MSHNFWCSKSRIWFVYCFLNTVSDKPKYVFCTLVGAKTSDWYTTLGVNYLLSGIQLFMVTKGFLTPPLNFRSPLGKISFSHPLNLDTPLVFLLFPIMTRTSGVSSKMKCMWHYNVKSISFEEKVKHTATHYKTSNITSNYLR